MVELGYDFYPLVPVSISLTRWLRSLVRDIKTIILFSTYMYPMLTGIFFILFLMHKRSLVSEVGVSYSVCKNIFTYLHGYIHTNTHSPTTHTHTQTHF